VQVAKAGILEIADVFVVNKADRDGAGEAARDLEVMLRMGASRDADWVPPVVKTSAATGEGVDDLWAAIGKHRAHLESTGALERNRRARLLAEVETLASQRVRERVRDALAADPGLAERVATREVDPYRAAATLLDGLAGSRG
jgi:LAO/AO transport system kinase